MIYSSQFASNNFSYGASQQPTLIHYKNCIYQGKLISNLKQQLGILLLDSGEVLISNFKNDQLNGQSLIFLNPETYVIGSFTRGLLDGNFVLRNSKLTIYWTVKTNKIQGEIVVINYEKMLARIWVIQSKYILKIQIDSEGYCTKQISFNQMQKQSQILGKISPYTEPIGLSISYLSQKFLYRNQLPQSPVSSSSFNKLKLQSISLTQTTQISLQTNAYYKIKLLLFKDRLIQYGIYHNLELQGLGYMIQGGSIYQGRFKNGKLDGYGIKIQTTQTNKIIYGSFKNGDIRTIDIVTDNQQQAKKQLIKYKKQCHIHALEFCNNYFNQRPVLMLENLLQMIQTNQENFTKQLLYEENVMERTYERLGRGSGDVEQGRGVYTSGGGNFNDKRNLQSPANKLIPNQNISLQRLSQNPTPNIYQSQKPENQKYTSRFVKSPQNSLKSPQNQQNLTSPQYFNNTDRSSLFASRQQPQELSQFSTSLQEYNMINKALKRFNR